jgi:hypothetical protein
MAYLACKYAHFAQNRKKKGCFSITDFPYYCNFVSLLELKVDFRQDRRLILPANTDVVKSDPRRCLSDGCCHYFAQFKRTSNNVINPFVENRETVERLNCPVRKVNTEIENVPKQCQSTENFAKFEPILIYQEEKKRAEDNSTVEVDRATDVLNVTVASKRLKFFLPFAPNLLDVKQL